MGQSAKSKSKKQRRRLQKRREKKFAIVTTIDNNIKDISVNQYSQPTDNSINQNL